MTNPKRSFTDTLQLLFQKGIRYSTLVDIGCADGSFYLMGHSAGYLRSAVPFHIDANPLYASSLKAIKEVVGGDYLNTAVCDLDDEIEITFSENPMWTSARPEGDLYWERITTSKGEKKKIKSISLDTIQEKYRPKPPYFLKLDIQGSELAALKGGKNFLKNTHTIVCECDMDDFSSINTFLDRSGFHLYDLVSFNYDTDGALGWFYAVYISDVIRQVLPKSFWKEDQTEAVIESHRNRRSLILEANARYLANIKANSVSKNAPCHCGSGKKYKHCCGA